MLKKHKMLVEYIAKKETEEGVVGLIEGVKFMKAIGNLAGNHGFDAYVKGYPKEVPDNQKKFTVREVEEDRLQKIVIPIGVAGEDIKAGQCVQLCDRGIVLKYRNGKIVEQEEKKQKKFTVKEVEDYYRKIEEGLDKGVVEHNKENKIDVLITSSITGFLRDHGQLEE